MKPICCVFAAFAFASCAQMSHVKDATTGGLSKVTGGMSKIGEASKSSFAKLMPSKIPVVEVREKELRELKTGDQQAVAFEKTRRQRFWIFGGPADFEEPDLPDTAGVMDGELLPPKME